HEARVWAWTLTLRRSRSTRQIAGVCGGLAEYFNMDATLLRVLFIVLAVLGGSGIVLYLALWIIGRRAPSRPRPRLGCRRPRPVRSTSTTSSSPGRPGWPAPRTRSCGWPTATAP